MCVCVFVCKLCVSKLPVGKLCVIKLCLNKLCVRGRRVAGVRNQKQEPHTKTWGKNPHQDKARNSTLNTFQPAVEFFLSAGNNVYLGLGWNLECCNSCRSTEDAETWSWSRWQSCSLADPTVMQLARMPRDYVFSCVPFIHRPL